MNVLDKITKLLALAKSPEIEEARNASHRAALLILEHKVELRVPQPTGDELFESIFGKSREDMAREVQRRIKEEAERRAWAPPQTHVDFKSPSGKKPRPVSVASWKRMDARHKGICQTCGKCIERRDDIFFKKAVGARHTACHRATQL